MKTTTIGRLLLVSVASLCLLVAAVAQVCAADRIVLGAAISMTGKFAREGGELKGGYDFWRNWVNARGGIDVKGKKYKVDIIYYDDKSDTMTAAKLTERLITEDKVNFLLAPYSSGIAFATSAIGERYHYITIAERGQFGRTLRAGVQVSLFRACPCKQGLQRHSRSSLQAETAPKTVAMLSLDSLLTILSTEGVRKHAKSLGLQEVYYAKFPAKTSDFSAMLTVLKAKNPDIIFFGGYFEDSVPFLKQCKELNVNPKAYAFLTAPQFEDWTKILGKDGDNVFGVMYWARAANWTGPYFSVKSFEETYKKQTGVPATLYNAQGAICGLLLQIAIEKGGSIDQEKVRETLRGMDVTTYFEPVKWDDKGENLKGRVATLQVQHGKVVSVDPPIRSEGDLSHTDMEQR